MSGSSFTSTVVGALACQKDSYLKSFKTIVVSCTEKVPDAKPEKSSKSKIKSKSKGLVPDDVGKLSLDDQKYYEIELKDTILFPEGGGQPSDAGIIKNLEEGKEITVPFIRRDGLLAKHKASEPIKPGTPVSVSVNWSKRFDYMQQHTGQHLLSAILDTYNLPTLSWKMALGETPSDLVNYLEIPRKLTDDEVEEISNKVNSRIVENISIKVEVPDDHSEHKTHKIPGDYDLDKGVLRIIHIGDLDANTCCGTHLSSTGQISAIALLHQSHVRGTNSRLHFLCGSRVAKYAKASHIILKSVSGLLSCQFDDISNKVDLLNTQLRKANSAVKSLLEDLAELKVKDIISKIEGDSGSSVVFQHFKDKGIDFTTIIFKELNIHYNKDLKSLKKTVVLLTGDLREPGSLMIFGGDSAKVQEVANGLKEKVSGLKGGGKDKWQGKVGRFEKGEIEAVKKCISEI